MITQAERIDIFDLDLSTLDKHWLEQSKLVFIHGNILAEAKGELERLKALFDVERAETMAKILAAPSEYELKDKPTVGAIEATINMDPDIIKKQEAIQTAKHSVDVCHVMMSALDHRKAALENLVKLHGQQYFATPQADVAGHEALQETNANRIKRHLRKRNETKDEQ